MKVSQSFETIGQDGEFAKKASLLCQDLGFDVVSSDEDWEDFRLEEESQVTVVSVDHYDDRVTIETMEDGEIITRVEFSVEDGDTIEKVKQSLI